MTSHARTASLTARTSQSHPLQIAEVAVPNGRGLIGITLCPGKTDLQAMSGPWQRDLKADVQTIVAWKAAAIVCLVEAFELEFLQVEGLPAATKEVGLAWFHLPIKDISTPDHRFEKLWRSDGAAIRDLLTAGQRVVIHCRGGLGRSGTVAAKLLIELGMEPEAAITLVRQQRPGAIETAAQEEYVRASNHIAPSGRGIQLGSDPRERAIGCFLGLALGDALGTTLEFSARDSKPPVADLVGGGPFNLEPGQWTDDTSMALCVADSLLACGKVVPADLIERFRRWRDLGYNSVNGQCFDIGITTSRAISAYVDTGSPLAGSTERHTAGNGSIMRLAPVPIFFAGSEPAAVEAAVLQSRTTHGAPECLDACRLMARILVRLIGGSTWDGAIAASLVGIKSAKVKRLATAAWRRKERPSIRSTGYVVDTLEAALWAVDRTTTFADAVLLAVNLGDDADTVGAVAGQLAGARYGRQSIPPKWVRSLAWSEDLVERAARLYQRQCGSRGLVEKSAQESP